MRSILTVEAAAEALQLLPSGEEAWRTLEPMIRGALEENDLREVDRVIALFSLATAHAAVTSRSSVRGVLEPLFRRMDAVPIALAAPEFDLARIEFAGDASGKMRDIAMRIILGSLRCANGRKQQFPLRPIRCAACGERIRGEHVWLKGHGKALHGDCLIPSMAKPLPALIEF